MLNLHTCAQTRTHFQNIGNNNYKYTDKIFNSYNVNNNNNNNQIHCFLSLETTQNVCYLLACACVYLLMGDEKGSQQHTLFFFLPSFFFFSQSSDGPSIESARRPFERLMFPLELRFPFSVLEAHCPAVGVK